MPKVIDNIELRMVDELRAMLGESFAADFCVGYFHLRGWRKLDDLIEQFEGGEGKCARVLVGMTRSPEEELRTSLSLDSAKPIDSRVAKRRETKLVESFKDQLVWGMPEANTEASLRRLARQLRAHKIIVKLFLQYPLHAKLYLTYNESHGAPRVSYVGSSNFTSPGLADQGELNVDVTDGDATTKLQKWFEDRWKDKFCVDISELLAEIIEQSWASETLVSPYHVYLKIAYHLAFEALEAPREYKLPTEFEDIVLDFQKEAILRARRMLRTDPANPARNRVAIIGDVVGMGKTLSASAVAKLYLDDEGGRCIVCCPPKLKPMWEDYLRRYAITGEVIPYSRTQQLAKLVGRSRLLILDESHNLRNRETIAWANLRDFIQDQEPKVLLLSATPYNKQYQDLSNQLRLVMDEKTDLGIRPEAYFRMTTEDQFHSKTQASPRSLVAFEHSSFADDWKDLLKQFMIRRTRGHIIRNYAQYDAERERHYLTLSSGIRSYFPKRVPKTLKFPVGDHDPFKRLFNDSVVDTIGDLTLPRYGLGGYVDQQKLLGATNSEKELLENLSQAGRRLIGYCRTNLFKRLESSGYSFLLSLERHALRNLVYVHAIDHALDLPIGTQDSALLDTSFSDADVDSEVQLIASDFAEEETEEQEELSDPVTESMADLQSRAAKVYAAYDARRRAGRRQFKWIGSSYFLPTLRDGLIEDARRLMEIVNDAGSWDAAKDAKLDTLCTLLTEAEKESKVLLFTQFADTARYLERELKNRGLKHVEAVTAETERPADKVSRFSPISNKYEMHPGDKPVRVMIATEVLSEGQNCQDANVVVNFDLPWAIIRLIQRAGRVDRIGQDNAEIRIYSCLPDDGVEHLIYLRRRLLARLQQNQDVIGTDEQFFEEEKGAHLEDIYAGKPGVLNDTEDFEDVDIPSQAKSIWDKALEADPTMQKKVLGLPEQVYATRHQADDNGALIYFKTADGFDSLVKVDKDGEMVTQSLTAILRQAECPPDEEPLRAHPRHHELVRKGVKQAIQHQIESGGNLGPKNSARRKAYERLTGYRADLRAHHDLFTSGDVPRLDKVIDDLHKYPLIERAREILNRRFREGINDADLAELAIGLRDDDRLSYVTENPEDRTPRLICSIGMFPREQVIPKEQKQ